MFPSHLGRTLGLFLCTTALAIPALVATSATADQSRAAGPRAYSGNDTLRGGVYVNISKAGIQWQAGGFAPCTPGNSIAMHVQGDGYASGNSASFAGSYTAGTNTTTIHGHAVSAKELKGSITLSWSGTLNDVNPTVFTCKGSGTFTAYCGRGCVPARHGASHGRAARAASPALAVRSVQSHPSAASWSIPNLVRAVSPSASLYASQ